MVVEKMDILFHPGLGFCQVRTERVCGKATQGINKAMFEDSYKI